MYQIAIDPITWDSAVAVGLFLIAVLPGLTLFGVKWYRKKTLFTPEYQHSQLASAASHEVEASKESQRVQITLRMALNTYVEFVAIFFEGAGTLPVVEGLDDWQWGQGKKAPNILIYPVPNDTRSAWYWQYQGTPHHRFRKARITIGLDFLATEYFNGHLFLDMTTVDGKKVQKLPFMVKRHSER